MAEIYDIRGCLLIFRTSRVEGTQKVSISDELVNTGSLNVVQRSIERYRMGYYDIDDVLADSVEFPCKFQYFLPGLGYLEGNPGKPIEKNCRLDLPLWLARILAIVGGDEEGQEDEEALPFVELLRPEMFSPKVVNAIKAGASDLDLHTINAHFYSLAVKWITLFGDEELAGVVSEMVLERSLEMNGHASSVAVQAAGVEAQSSLIGSPFLITMDESEKQLYRLAHDSYKRTKKWIIQT